MSIQDKQDKFIFHAFEMEYVQIDLKDIIRSISHCSWDANQNRRVLQEQLTHDEY